MFPFLLFSCPLSGPGTLDKWGQRWSVLVCGLATEAIRETARVSLGFGSPGPKERSIGALRRPAVQEPSISPWFCDELPHPDPSQGCDGPPEAQDAVGGPAFGVLVPHGGWAGVGRAHVELGDWCVGFPLTARTLVAGLQIRPRAASGAPALLRGRHGGPERLGEHGPAHLRPLQPGQCGHAGGCAPPTPCPAVWVPGLGPG